MDIYKLDNKVIIDDYAHHPTEIESVLNTIQTNYKNKSKAVVFHLIFFLEQGTSWMSLQSFYQNLMRYIF